MTDILIYYDKRGFVGWNFPGKKLMRVKEYGLYSLFNYCLYFRKQQTGEIMSIRKYTEEQERLARFAKAMGHPARMAILQFLASQESCFFGDIHEVLPIAKATVSQHLKELKEAGLIQGEIETPKVKYCLNKENWEIARNMFADFFGQRLHGKVDCCR